MRLFGLIGYPLSHSFSKKYFTEKFEKEGLKDCVYENFPIASIDQLRDILKKPGLEGFNITIPYKEQVIGYLDDSETVVKQTKACNCVRIRNNKLMGYNTDIVGFEASLVKTLDRSKHTKALILGTGGSARAVQYVLSKLGIIFRHVSRKPSARSLSYEQITPAVIKEHLLIVNTTPLGMYPNVIQAPQLPYDALTKDHFLFDLIYNPEKTLFLKSGEAKGAQVKNGYEMLVLQAEENWRIWNS